MINTMAIRKTTTTTDRTSVWPGPVMKPGRCSLAAGCASSIAFSLRAASLGFRLAGRGENV